MKLQRALRMLAVLATAGGCAAKYSAARLETLLAGIVPPDAGDLLVLTFGEPMGAPGGTNTLKIVRVGGPV